MKNLYLIIFLFIGIAASAQAPEKMSYQAVLRDANGALLKSQNVNIQFTVNQTSASGTTVYQEYHTPTTNTNGLVSIYIGTGTVSSGNFSAIDWSNGTYFLQTDIDPAGGTNYVINSTTELVSVPYALHANLADSLIGGVNETDPVFDASVAKGITAIDTTYWNDKLDSSSIQNFVDLTTSQTVAGAKTFSSDIRVNGITVGKGGGASASNTATGDSALFFNTSGFSNTANGAKALRNNTTGSYNSAIGTQALNANTTGINNTANGSFALRDNTTGRNNTANGNRALYSNTVGVGNTANGAQALKNNTIGNRNTANGDSALYSNTIGYANTANGAQALKNNTTGSVNTANGSGALYTNTTGNYNTANGVDALRFNTTGSRNTANGYLALYYNTTGYGNTANGQAALLFNTTGNNNTANGKDALQSNTTGNNNTANGVDALIANKTGSNNTANGQAALYNNSTGYNNIANGVDALRANTTGFYNTANGVTSLYSNSTGRDNTANGHQSLLSNTTGIGNTANGAAALTTNTTGNRNTAIGYFTNVSSNNLSNATALGNGATASASNKVRIGNTSVSVIEGQVAFTSVSDGRIKENVQEAVAGLSFITQLRPVTYTLNTRKQDEITMQAMPDSVKERRMLSDADYLESSSIVRTGFIAQEVEAAAKKVGFDFDGVSTPQNETDLYGIRYAEFVVPLVKAIQEQQETIEGQQEMIDGQQAIIEQQKKDYLLLLERIEALEKE